MTEQPAQTSRFTFKTLGLLLLPLLLLGGVIAIFLNTGGGLSLESPVPVEGLTIETLYPQTGPDRDLCAKFQPAGNHTCPGYHQLGSVAN